MAERNYLVEGLSGAGKSSVYEELIRRGYKGLAPTASGRTMPTPESPEPKVLFVCGSSRNRDHFLPYFTKVVNLRIDDDTMRRRLYARTADDWDVEPGEIERVLELNRSGEKPAGAIDRGRYPASQPGGRGPRAWLLHHRADLAGLSGARLTAATEACTFVGHQR
jgi:hypothetical protein